MQAPEWKLINLNPRMTPLFSRPQIQGWEMSALRGSEGQTAANAAHWVAKASLKQGLRAPKVTNQPVHFHTHPFIFLTLRISGLTYRY